MNLERALIIKGRSGAGLGDHILSLLAGLAYAKIHRRSVWVDWREGALANRGSDAFGALFRLIRIPVCESRPMSDDVIPTSWRGWLDADSFTLWERDRNTRWDRAAYSRTYSVPLLADCEAGVVVHVLSDELPELLAKQESISGRPAMDRWLRRFARTELALHPGVEDLVAGAMTALPRPLAGIHLRLTDKSPAPLEAYVACARSLLRRQPAMNFYITSDLPNVQSAFVQVLGADRVHVLPKWMPEDGAPIHLSASNPDVLASTREALRDLSVLARCDWLFYNPASSFGYCAALLSSAPESQIREVTRRRSLLQRVLGKMSPKPENARATE